MKLIFGSNLKSVRQEKGVSLTKLAELCDVSRSMLAKIENCESIPTVLVAARIASALHVTVSELLEEPILAEITVVTKADRIIQLNPSCKIAREVVMPYNARDGLAIYSFAMPPGSTTGALPAHEKGTFEYVLATKGKIKVIVDGVPHILSPGDCIRFTAHTEHEVVCISAIDAEFLAMYVFKKAVK